MDGIESIELMDNNEVWLATMHGIIVVQIDASNMAVRIKKLIYEGHQINCKKKIYAKTVMGGTQNEGLHKLKVAYQAARNPLL